MRYVPLVAVVLRRRLLQRRRRRPPRRGRPRAAPIDPQHQNLTAPHGDHSPHKGGMVLMNGDIHYEVVFSRDGRHRVWFSDAVRAELPASVATGVTMTITREGEPEKCWRWPSTTRGESWMASAASRWRATAPT